MGNVVCQRNFFRLRLSYNILELKPDLVSDPVKNGSLNEPHKR
jgi:hypothetical protein